MLNSKQQILPNRLFVIALLTLSGSSLSGCEQSPPENTQLWAMSETCNLHQETCTSELEGRSVSLKISPHPIPIARPLGIEVSLDNIEAEKVELDISGMNMYMGYNRVPLTATKQPGHYIGTSMLAFCTNKKMEWQITLMIHQKDGSQIQIPYRLDTMSY